MLIGGMGDDEFERFMCDLLPRIYSEFDRLEPSFNSIGKTTKGKCDAHVYHAVDDTYTPIICSTQQTNIKSKIIEDIYKLSATNFASKIRRVILCVNSPIKDEIEEYRNACQERGWNLEAISLERMTQFSLNHADLLAEYFREMLPESGQENLLLRRFDCGLKLKEAREDLGVSISKLIEYIDFSSERDWKNIENGHNDVSEKYITAFSDFSGISADWIKHGSGKKYSVEKIYDYQMEKIDSIASKGVLASYMLIDPKPMDILLLVQFSEYHWKVYEFAFTLDFWNWIGDERHIPTIFELLKGVKLKLNYPQGRIVSSQLIDELKSGAKHISTSFKSIGQNKYWFDDLFDIYHKYPIAQDYERQHGEWFVRLQSEFCKYIKDESADCKRS